MYSLTETEINTEIIYPTKQNMKTTSTTTTTTSPPKVIWKERVTTRHGR